MGEITLTETVSVSTRDITEEERYLSHQYNSLIEECIRWGRQQMAYGSHGTRLAIAKSVLSSASRLAALENKTQTETHRIAFQQLLSQMTAVDVAATDAITSPTDDQN